MSFMSFKAFKHPDCECFLLHQLSHFIEKSERLSTIYTMESAAYEQ